MRCFTIADGAEYKPFLEMIVPAFRWATGMELEVYTKRQRFNLPEKELPFAHKLVLVDEISEDEQVVFIDADICFLRKQGRADKSRQVKPVIEWLTTPYDSIGCVPSSRVEGSIRSVIESFGVSVPIDVSKFVNTGLFIASHAHKHVMQRTLELMAIGKSRLHEETALNIAIQELGAPVHFLPRKLHRQVGPNLGDLGVHVCYCKTVPEKVEEMRRVISVFGDPELQDLLKIKPYRAPPRSERMKRAAKRAS